MTSICCKNASSGRLLTQFIHKKWWMHTVPLLEHKSKRLNKQNSRHHLATICFSDTLYLYSLQTTHLSSRCLATIGCKFCSFLHSSSLETAKVEETDPYHHSWPKYDTNAHKLDTINLPFMGWGNKVAQVNNIILFWTLWNIVGTDCCNCSSLLDSQNITNNVFVSTHT